MADSVPAIDDLVTEVSEEVTVMASAKSLIDGFASRIQAAKDEALKNGATEAQLQPLTKLKADLDSSGNDLAASVAANTPAA